MSAGGEKFSMVMSALEWWQRQEHVPKTQDLSKIFPGQGGEGREAWEVLAEYLPSLTYRKLAKCVRNGLERWASHKGGGQVSVCVSRLMPRAIRRPAGAGHGRRFLG